jgi:Transcriptional regulators
MYQHKMIAYMSRLSSYHHRMVVQAFPHLHIGAGQYPILLWVHKHPGISQDELAEQMLLNKSSVARSAAHLQKNGYLSRSTNPANKRAYLLTLTRQGEEILPQILSAVRQSLDMLTAGLGEEQVMALEQALFYMVTQNTK